MKTTRALLSAAAVLLTLAIVAFALLNLRLPAAELFGYGTGGLSVLGLLVMLASESPARRLTIASRRPSAAPSAARPTHCRPPARRLIAHAA